MNLAEVLKFAKEQGLVEKELNCHDVRFFGLPFMNAKEWILAFTSDGVRIITIVKLSSDLEICTYDPRDLKEYTHWKKQIKEIIAYAHKVNKERKSRMQLKKLEEINQDF